MGRVEELVPHRGEGIELQLSVIGLAQALHAALAGLPEARIQSPGCRSITRSTCA